MRSKHKLSIVAKVFPEFGNKLWVAVEVLHGNRFVPSFEDLYRIIRGIVYCEREKYPNLPRDPGEMVKEFLGRCVDLSDAEYEFAWQRLREEFQVPDRCAPRRSGGSRP
jgi:hypothetical protein